LRRDYRAIKEFPLAIFLAFCNTYMYFTVGSS